MKIHPKQFYNTLGILGILIILSILVYSTVKVSDEKFFFIGGMFLYLVVLMISVALSSRRWFRINLPFVSNLIDVPTSPTYRVEKNCWGEYEVIKSEVGFTYYDEDILWIFPPLMFLDYKTMVDFEDTFVIEGTLHEIKDINLKEYWESEYFNKHQEYIEAQEIMENGENLLEKINKQYLNNFK
mgnify:CR=1 FL=1